MINRSTSNLIVYGLAGALCLLALGFTDHLSWREHVRLLVILVGLVVLYLRYRPSLSVSAGDDDSSEGGAASFRAGVVVALSLLFVVTQYDPATSNLALRSTQPRDNWFFWLSTALVTGMGVCFLATHLDAMRWSRLRLIDRIFTGVVLGVVVISLGSKKLIGPGITGQDLLANFKILSYLAIWFPVTRAFSDPACALLGDSRLPPALGRVDRWLGFMGAVSLLIVVTVITGAVQAGRVFSDYRKAQSLLAAGDLPGARQGFEHVQELNRTLDFGPIRDRVLADLAVLHLRQGNQAEAQQAIGALKSATYDAAASHLKVARVYADASVWAQAAEAYLAYLEKAGKDTEVLDELGGAYLQIRDSRGLLNLIERFKYVPQLEAETFEEQIFIGNVHFYREDYLDAQQAYEQAAAERPNDSYAVYKVGRALLARERYEAAMARFRQAIELEPDFADAHYRLGVCYEKQGNVAEARRLYEETVELLPNHLDGLLALKRMREANVE